MCPNCLTHIALGPLALLGASLSGAGSAAILAAAGLRSRAVRAPEATQLNTEETAS